MILITTAGKVGSEAARQLAQRGEQVRDLIRSPKKASALAHAGAEAFEGDLDVPASVDEAMQGVSRVVLVTPPVVHQEADRDRQRRPRRRRARREDHHQGLGRLADRPDGATTRRSRTR